MNSRRLALGGTLGLLLVSSLWFATRGPPNPFELPPGHANSLRMRIYNEGDVTFEELRLRTSRREYSIGDLSPGHSFRFLVDEAPAGTLSILSPQIDNATNSHEFEMVEIRNYDDDETYYDFAIYLTPTEFSTATTNCARSEFDD